MAPTSARSSTLGRPEPSSSRSDRTAASAGARTKRASYSSFCTFDDPDGNTWLLQEITTRLPGRVDSAATSFASVDDLTEALIRAATAHGEHEKREGGVYDTEWPAWYASYMVAERNGEELPT